MFEPDGSGEPARVVRSAGCGGLPSQEVGSFLLGQPAPHAIRLTHMQRMLTALLDHWAGSADGLGVGVTATARGAPFSLRVEELFIAGLPARPLVLPFPQIHDRARKPGELCHDATSHWLPGRCGWNPPGPDGLN